MEDFLCPLPCATVDGTRNCHSISLIYIAHVAVIIRQNLLFYGLPIIIAEITSHGVSWMFVKIGFSRFSLHSMAVKSP